MGLFWNGALGGTPRFGTGSGHVSGGGPAPSLTGPDGWSGGAEGRRQMFPTKQGYAVDQTFSVVLAADNVPQVCHGYQVPEGATVRVRANNGTTAGNSAVIFVASNRRALLQGLGKPLAPLDDVLNPVSNTAQIWIMGKAGDGVVIGITRTPGT